MLGGEGRVRSCVVCRLSLNVALAQLRTAKRRLKRFLSVLYLGSPWVLLHPEVGLLRVGPLAELGVPLEPPDGSLDVLVSFAHVDAASDGGGSLL